VLIVGCCRRSWVLVRGVVLGRVRRWWGGAGPLSVFVGGARRRRGEGGDEVWALWTMVVVEEQEKD